MMNLISPFYNFFCPATLRTERDEQFWRIKFIHGTNSAILTTISQTNYQVLATGHLMDRGIAPMGGELTWNGMMESGISQHSISGGTLEDIDKCWKRYALDRSNSFNPDELTPEKFEEAFSKLEKTRQSSDKWDGLIIRLMRYKQWKPEEFDKLCAQNQARVDALVQRTQPKLCYADYLLKALDYDAEEMKKGIGDFQKRREILEELGYEWQGDDDCFMLGIWQEELDFRTGSDTKPNAELYEYDGIDKRLFGRFLVDIINFKLSGNLNKEIECKMQIWNPYETIKPRISMYQKPEDQRYKRLHLLFDPAHTPLTFRTLEQQESILKPFPMLLGSTNANPRPIQWEQTILSGATLGTDIDVMVVRPQDAPEASRWLKAHFLAHRITLYSSEILPTSEVEPPPPCPFITSEAFAEAHKKVNEQILPVYRTDYPGGGKKYWHGVLHSARAFLFTQIQGYYYASHGTYIEAKPENLLITAAGNDMAREGDGPDYWDAQSGARCKEILLQNGVEEEEASMFEKAIAEKESAVTLEQKIVHDADCIEINRCLNNPDDFESDRLWMKSAFTEGFLSDFIEQSKGFIKLTQNEKIKDYIESSADPIATLYQILFYCHEQYGMFGKLCMAANEHKDHFGGFVIDPLITELIDSTFQG